MYKIEIKDIPSCFYQIQFINIIRDYTKYKPLEIINMINILKNGNSLIIEFNSQNILTASDFVMKLANMGFKIIRTNFHEEENDNW